MPRMTRVLLWLPALPPVSVSMGMKVTSRGRTAKAFSYFARIPPVIMLLTMSIKSHMIRFFASMKMLVFK